MAVRTDREIERLSDEIQRALVKGPWHGPSLVSLLDGVSENDAAEHPIPGAHSIWELVAHLTAWAREAARRIREGTCGEPPEGDWPEIPAPTKMAWRSAKDALDAAHRELLDELEKMSPDALDETLRDDRKGSTPTSRALLLHGVAQHDAYHGGQIALLRKAVSARSQARSI